MRRAFATWRSWFRRSAAGAVLASMLVLVACDGNDAPGGADAGEGSTEVAVEEADSTETHTHDGSGEHSHDGAPPHTHATADTLAANVVLDAGADRDWTGSATLLSVGDSVRVLISVDGARAGARHSAELVAGDCRDPGARLATLTPVATGTSGGGSSQTYVPSARLDGRAHGALRVAASDGSPAACAQVHFAVADHGHGDDGE